MEHISGPMRVDANDKQTRKRAAVAVGRAYTRSPLGYLALLIFGAMALWTLPLSWSVATGGFGLRWTIGVTVLTLLCLTAAIGLVPLATGWTIYRAKELYYVDTGTARAALAVRPDHRRRQLDGDRHTHTFGAHPRKKKAGRPLGEWVRDHIHAQGGRVTGTAFPGLARHYIANGMVEDGRTWWFLIRVASRPRPR